jgi:tripartite-type tricarboxylate transporter receptor subunit TctC
MKRQTTILSAAIISSTLLLGGAPAWSQADAYPSRQITSICMFPPGTGADVFVRFFATKLQDLAGKPVIVDNKVGAFGNIATEAVARSRPDGYTIYIAPGSSVLASSPSLFKKLNYDPINDFEHVTTLAKIAFMLIVEPKSPHKTVADLTAHLKARGDKASYGSAANTGLVAAELYKAAFGLPTVEVKYRAIAEALNDLQGGQLEFAFIDTQGGLEQSRAGRVRALMVTSAQRMASVPELPGAAEAGVPEMDLVAWWSVHTPAKTPKPILDKLEGWFNQIVQMEETKQFLNRSGSDPFPGNSGMLKDLLAKDTRAWADYVKLAKIEPQ